MSLLKLFKRPPKIKGELGYYHLVDWWLSEFTEDERQYIQQRFQPVGSSDSSLISGDISFTSESAIKFLSALAGWFYKDNDRQIAHKILGKAESLISEDSRTLDVHFLFSEKIKIYYKDRDKTECLEKAISACKQQIKLAPKAAEAFKVKYNGKPLPSHKGYEQLAIIYAKQKRFNDVIDLCNQALEQGWAGDWESRIDRSKKKLGKI